jgi:hypothetical protein
MVAGVVVDYDQGELGGAGRLGNGGLTRGVVVWHRRIIEATV